MRPNLTARHNAGAAVMGWGRRPAPLTRPRIATRHPRGTLPVSMGGEHEESAERGRSVGQGNALHRFDHLGLSPGSGAAVVQLGKFRAVGACRRGHVLGREHRRVPTSATGSGAQRSAVQDRSTATTATVLVQGRPSWVMKRLHSQPGAPVRSGAPDVSGVRQRSAVSASTPGDVAVTTAFKIVRGRRRQASPRPSTRPGRRLGHGLDTGPPPDRVRDAAALQSWIPRRRPRGTDPSCRH